jgi:hypothetical protein
LRFAMVDILQSLDQLTYCRTKKNPKSSTQSRVPKV